MSQEKIPARWSIVRDELERVDAKAPGKSQPDEKHLKMTRSPFQFYRGSAQLFYADLASRLIDLPNALLEAPNTAIMGDCHFSNFGFFTEEGSAGHQVIWTPNDFDDACEGPAVFDLLRFLTSLHLIGDYLEGLVCGRYASDEIEGTPSDRSTPSAKGIENACRAFVKTWVKTTSKIIKDPSRRDEALSTFKKSHFLEPHLEKALKRTIGGKKFLEKSTIGKLVTFDKGAVAFQCNNEKLALPGGDEKNAVSQVLRPYMDDDILDVALRRGAGTGSVNVERYYLLVGPSRPLCKEDLSLVHVVEVKQQREAAMIHHFPDISPVNQLMPAHLTVDQQRKMMRKPDLILDDLHWKGHQWLVRSRHHARYGVDPEDLFQSHNIDKALKQYAKACAKALAFAHSRGDRRSTHFEAAMVEILGAHGDTLRAEAQKYAAQVVRDHAMLCRALGI